MCYANLKDGSSCFVNFTRSPPFQTKPSTFSQSRKLNQTPGPLKTLRETSWHVQSRQSFLLCTFARGFVDCADRCHERQPWSHARVQDYRHQSELSADHVALLCHGPQQECCPLYELGKPEKGNGLKLLAEDGMASDLVDHYTMMEKDGVFSAEGVGGPTPGGGSSSFNIKTSGSFEYLSIASMAIFTNDCFVGMAGVKLQDDMSYLVPGYDAGTEMNNELATHVPALGGTDGTDSGEGFVHVHRGINGGGDLTVLGYDWRNPMLHVEIERVH